MKTAPGNSFTSFPLSHQQRLTGMLWAGDEISSWLPQSILSPGNMEETGPKRFIDVKGSATHTSANRPWFGRRKGKMKQKGKLSVFEIIFCVFSSAFPVSVFEVYGWAGSLKRNRAPELSSCLSFFFFFLESEAQVRQPGHRD